MLLQEPWESSIFMSYSFRHIKRGNQRALALIDDLTTLPGVPSIPQTVLVLTARSLSYE